MPSHAVGLELPGQGVASSLTEKRERLTLRVNRVCGASLLGAFRGCARVLPAGWIPVPRFRDIGGEIRECAVFRLLRGVAQPSILKGAGVRSVKFVTKKVPEV
jgi:hypothetical protein